MKTIAKSPVSSANARLPVGLALVVFCVALLCTFGLWKHERDQADQVLAAEFAFEVRQTTRRIEQRMATYEQVARGTQAFLLGSLDIAREDFRLFVSALRLQEKFPGIQGLALIESIPESSLDLHTLRIRAQGFPEYAVHPAGERRLYSSIIQIEPFSGLNLRALGYDMLSDETRRIAMERARDTGLAAASGKIKLVQETSGVQTQAGLVMYLPVYRRGAPVATREERQANLIAWIGAPFRMNDLMAGFGGERSSEIFLTIYDGDTPSVDSLLYRSEEAGPTSLMSFSKLASQQKISVAGRTWTLDLHSSPGYEARVDRKMPHIIAIGGVATSFLLAFLVWALASARTRALGLATAMTQKLWESNARVKSERRRMQSILDNTHDAFVALNSLGNITDWNTRAESIFGWPASEALGKDLAELIIPVESREGHRAGFARFLVTQEPSVTKRVVEVTGLHRSGRLIPLELAVAAVAEKSGIVVSAFIRDVSERTEAARKETERTHALEEARAALQHSQRLEAVGKLTGGVAHDFNNVLQILGGNIQILERLYAQDERLQTRLASMARAVARGAKLSAQLLAFARRQPLRPVVLDLRSVIEELEDSLCSALGGAVTLQLNMPDRIWNVMVDRSQLENVIMNVALNARDAMPNGGKLTIALQNTVLDAGYVNSHPDASPGEYALIAVSDEGEGMSEAIIAQAFEPFFTTKRPGEGTGLGLSMAYGFVKQSGGHIRLRSRLGHGTLVEIYLPRSAEKRTEQLLQVDQPVSGGNEHILVVEDDRDVQNAVVLTLEELGYRVTTADNGRNALDLLENGLKPSLLFTDVVMPGSVPSTELANRAKLLVPDIAILFTSGYTHNALVQGGRLNAGVELLSKPYAREELAVKIRQIISSKAIPPSSQVAVGNN